MKLNKFRAVLQERPWLRKSISQITGTHPSDIEKSGGNWEKHIEEWAVRNISEITIRAFEELNLDERAEFVRHRHGELSEKITFPNGYRWRRYEFFTHTEYQLFCRSTYEGVSPYDKRDTKPFVYCSTISTIHAEGAVPTVRESIRNMRRPHYPIGTTEEIKTPYVFEVIIRITKLGVVGLCSSTIIDIYPFPANFDVALNH